MHDNEYSLRDYGKMVRDEARFRPYVEALKRYVTPDSVVLDIGAGTGVLSFLACQLGARRVFAIERDDCIEIGQLCAANIPGSDRIEWIRDLSTRITLPEAADIVVGDLHGTMPFYRGNIASLADARKRHLKPDGHLLPQCDLVYAAPAFAPEEIRSVDAPWRQNEFGLDFTAALPYITSTWWRARAQSIDADCLLAAPALWGIVDYRTADEGRLDAMLEFRIERHGQLHGYYVWFDSEVADGLALSNSPLLPELVYGRAFFPLEQSVDVRAGDLLRTRLATYDIQGTQVYRWDSDLSPAGGRPGIRFRQSTFKLLPSHGESLQQRKLGHIPTLGEAGEIERMILTHIDGHHSLGDIAQKLAQAFPEHFRSLEAALNAVAAESERYGRQNEPSTSAFIACISGSEIS